MAEHLHIVVLFVQLVTLYPAPVVDAFGENVPSHKSIIWSEYHCLIPSTPANLSTRSFSMLVRSFSMVEVTFSTVPVRQEMIEVQLEPGEDEVAVAFKRLWPRVDVFSLLLSAG
jgi:hypothetical protein